MRNRLICHPDSVTAYLPATYVALAENTPLSGTVTLEYECADPYAFLVEILSTGGRTRTWLFARELLRDGVRSHVPVGLGDVRVWTPRWRRRVHIRLSTATGSAVVQIRRTALRALLKRTDALVPPGTESDQLRLDAELDTLLGTKPDA